MSLDTFRRLAEWSIAGTSSPRLTFLFHGGEPTLLGPEWFRNAIEFALGVARNNSRQVRFAVQTNGVSVSDSLLDLFAHYRLRIGISADGPALRPAMRPSISRVVPTIKRARQAGLRPGIVLTLNHTNWDRFGDIYAWLRDELGVFTFKVNTVASVGHGRHLSPLSRGHIFEANETLLECMTQSLEDGPFEVNLAREVLRFFSYRSSLNPIDSLCSGNPCGAGASVIGVSPDGRVLPCGRFGWDDEAFTIGHLGVDPPSDEPHVDIRRVEAFHALRPQNWQDCADCQARRICSFGCQAFIARSQDGANVECGPTQDRYSYFQRSLQRLRPLADALATHFPPPDVDTPSDAYGDDGYSDLGYSDYHDDGYVPRHSH